MTGLNKSDPFFQASYDHYEIKWLLMLLFEWDPKKARSNEQKHGITFNEASSVFADALSLTIHDPLHSEDEERFIIIGVSFKNRILTVVHTERKDKLRIISARKSTNKERCYYENHAE